MRVLRAFIILLCLLFAWISSKIMQLEYKAFIVGFGACCKPSLCILLAVDKVYLA